MRRLFIFSALCTLLCFMFGLHSVRAEGEVDMTKWITLTVKQGEKIKLDFAASTAGVWVKVTGVTDEKAEEAPTQLHGWKQQPEYEAKGTEIKVYGATERFTCYGNKENLTALVSQNENLTYLDCSANLLSSLDITKNVNLTELDCSHNQLSDFDVTQNVSLRELDCRYNKISALDVRKHVNLTKLYCDTNLLSSLDVSQNINLKTLDCRSNRLSSLDVSQNVNLTSLNCYDNQIANLDVSTNVALSDLSCSMNLLSSLDVSRNVNLTSLFCSKNQLSDLDISKNTKLVKLNLYSNNFSTSILNNIYCQLPDLTGKENGLIYMAAQVGEVIDELLVRSTSKTITDAKNWVIQYYFGDTNIEEITGNYTCGSVYGLTLAPATIPSFSYQGGEKKITVTSTGNWKLDETALLPAWLSVEPKQGSSGTQVTVTAVPNAEKGIHRAALTFLLSDAENTKQVVVLTQTGRPEEFITVAPFQDYIFPIEGETKENYFTVESTGEWTVTSSNAEWFPVETKSGAAGTTKVTIKADANSKGERKTKLTFALKEKPDVKQVVMLTQKGTSDPTPNPNAVEDVALAGTSIAPNPFSSQLIVRNNEVLAASYELVNTNGIVVRAGTLQGAETVLDTENLTVGVYLLRIFAGSESKTLRVVKE